MPPTFTRSRYGKRSGMEPFTMTDAEMFLRAIRRGRRRALVPYGPMFDVELADPPCAPWSLSTPVLDVMRMF